MKKELSDLYLEYIELRGKSSEIWHPESFIKHIHADYLDNNIRLPAPLYVTWDITNSCNLHCQYCSASALYSSKGMIENQDTISIAHKLIDSGVRYVSIRGGEPTLVKQLPEIINLLDDAGVFIEVTSNGFGLTPKFFDQIKEINKLKFRLKISLDSHIAELNDNMRGSGSYTSVLSAIETCNKSGWDYRIQMAVDKRNRYQIKDMYLFANEHNAKSFGFNIITPYGRGKSIESVKLDEIILTQIIDILRNPKYTILERYSLGLDEFAYIPLITSTDINDEDANKISILKCNGGKTRLNIDENGDCYPCEMLKIPEFKLGNILNDDIATIWNSEILSEFNKINRNNKVGCKDCPVKICNTGCIAMSIYNRPSTGNLIPNCRIKR